MSWVERAVDRSPIVQRSRSRGVEQATAIVAAARRLIGVKGSSFTTQELVKEAGVALQTFYRYFGGKDQLLLAVIEDMIAEFCVQVREQAGDMSDPIERLRFYVSLAARPQIGGREDVAGARFITVEHWRLQQLYPDEIADAIRPFTVLIEEEIDRATAEGALHPSDPHRDAWHITQLVLAVFHHYAFATTDDAEQDSAEQLWQFCLTGLGGTG